MRDEKRRFPSLPGIHGESLAPLRVCIASRDIAGPYDCGGVGAAYRGLALALADAGHRVTIAYTHHEARRGLDYWRADFAKRGIRFVHAPQPAPYWAWHASSKEASFFCYQRLKELGPFDVIHFHEWLGLPYYSLLAKQQGLAFEGTLLCVGTHGPCRWSREGDGRLAEVGDELIVDFMERRCVELADVVVSPSHHLLEWLLGDDWKLPERSYVQQNLLPGPEIEKPPDPTPVPLKELVFFGRLDRRKGLPFFCDVLDRLVEDGSARIPVTFLGANANIERQTSERFIAARASRWPFPHRVISSASRIEALRYLSAPGRVAVIPSLVDNLPCTVHECIQHGFPFVASDIGGIPELVHPSNHANALVPLKVEAWVGRLKEILVRGQAPAAPATPEQQTRDHWLAWHASLGRRQSLSGRPRTAQPPPAEEPTISVCVAHYERPHLLPQMLDSLRVQTWKGMEVIVADDGSTSPKTQAYLRHLRDDFEKCGWSLLTLDHVGPARARHAAAQQARGDYLLFLDDDDWIEPDTVETLARVATHTSADALVSVGRRFEGDGPPDPKSAAESWLVPLGPALVPGLIAPELGGTLILVRPTTYFACGGFPDGFDVDEDWEFLLELVARGYELQVVPEVLFWYRQQAQSRSRADNGYMRDTNRIRRFERLLPPEFRDLAELAYGKLSGAGSLSGVQRTGRVRRMLEQHWQATT